MIEKEAVAALAGEHGELEKTAAERVAEIAREFTEGFKFLENYPRSVTFFGSAKSLPADPDYEKARELAGRIVKELGYTVVSGGGPGIMEAANRGAFEAGGNAVGLLINLPNAQPTNSYITKAVSFYYFFVRKVCLAFGAEVFVFFPGGYGTLDEFFEIMTLLQTQKVKGAPIICYGTDYWNKMKDFIRETLLAKGVIDKGDEDLFTVTDDLDDIIAMIRQAPVRGGIPLEFAAPQAV